MNLRLAALLALLSACRTGPQDGPSLEVVPPHDRLAITGDWHTVELGFNVDHIGDVMALSPTYRNRVAHWLDRGGMGRLNINTVYSNGLDPDTATAVIEASHGDGRVWDDSDGSTWSTASALDHLVLDLGLHITAGLDHTPFRLQAAGYSGPGDLALAADLAQAELPDLYDDEGAELGLLDEAVLRNGFPPVFDQAPNGPFGMAEWTQWVTDLTEQVHPDTLAGLRLETANEPEGLRFFWGSGELHSAKAMAALDGAAGQGVPVWVGGLSAATVAGVWSDDALKADNQHSFRAELAAFPFDQYSQARPSFHMFRYVGCGTQGLCGTSEKTWADLDAVDDIDLQGAVLSSYHLYATASDWQEALMQSDYFMNELVDLYRYAYDQRLQGVYFHKLMNVAADPSPMGFLKHDTSPTHAFKLLLSLQAVVADGYFAEEWKDGTTGQRHVALVGRSGLVLEAADGPIAWQDDRAVVGCSDQQVALLPANPVLAQTIDDLVRASDWVLYEPVLPGTGTPCP